MSEDRHPAGSGQELPLTQTGEATRPSAGARSPGRRGFLLGVGGLAAAALVGPGGGWLGSEQTTSGSASSTQPVGSGLGLDVEARRARALELRLTTAHQQLGDPFPQPAANGDEDRYDVVVGLANFTKALPHNPLGEVDPDAYRALLRALRSGRPADFKRIPLGGRAKLANPEGAFSFELQGPDPWQRPLAPPPAMRQRGVRRRDDRVLLARPGPRCPLPPLRPGADHRRRHHRPAPLRCCRLPRPGRRNPVSQHRPPAARGEQRSVHLPVPAAALRLWQHPDHPAVSHHRGGQRPPHQLCCLAGGPERPPHQHQRPL